MCIKDFSRIIWKSPVALRQVCRSEDLPLNKEEGSSGMFIIGSTQIAIFRLPDNRIFASQNMCGHRPAFVLSEGGLEINSNGEATVSCPLHYRRFKLDGPDAGKTSGGSFRYTIATFDCHEEDGFVYVALPDKEELDSVLGTDKWTRTSSVQTRHRSPALSLALRNDEPEKPHACKVLDPQLSW